MQTKNIRIGIDLGGTKTEAIALGPGGQEILRRRVPSPQHNYQATINTIVELVDGIEKEIECKSSVGVGIPGAISPKTGWIKNANSTWLVGHALDKDLAKALNRPVRLANDANCLAVSEASDGAAAGLGVVFAVILGTGTGGGLAIDGKVHAGGNAIAGEWGHNPLPWPTAEEYPGQPCYCGKSGCVETWLSGPGAAAEFTRVTGRTLKTEEIVKAAETRDPQALAALDRYVERLGRALAAVINILDPDAIVLGGGLSNIEMLYTKIQVPLAKWCFSDAIETPILKSAHGDSSGVRGAAWLWPDPTN